jgi:hypothetical protein
LPGADFLWRFRFTDGYDDLRINGWIIDIVNKVELSCPIATDIAFRDTGFAIVLDPIGVPEREGV